MSSKHVAETQPLPKNVIHSITKNISVIKQQGGFGKVTLVIEDGKLRWIRSEYSQPVDRIKN